MKSAFLIFLKRIVINTIYSFKVTPGNFPYSVSCITFYEHLKIVELFEKANVLVLTPIYSSIYMKDAI